MPRPRPRRPRQSTPDRPEPAPAPEPVATVFWTRRRVVLAVVALLSVQATLAVRSLVTENPTIDEVVHLPAGLTYWQTGTFRLYHHSPPLARMFAALPVLASGPHVDYKSPAWKSEPPNKAAMAHEFMQLNAARYFELFTRARLLMPVFALIGGLVVFFWSRKLYGDAGGLVSLCLWTFCPNILAHTRLVTTDAAATAFGVLATYLFWRYLRGPTWRRAALAGAALGLAQLTKFSLLVLYGLWPLLAIFGHVADVVAYRRGKAPAVGLPGPGRLALHGLLVVALSVMVIDVGYGFEGVGLPLGDYEFASQTLTRPATPGERRPRHSDELLDGAYHFRVNRFRGSPLAHLPVPLPKHYMLGFDDQKLEAEGIPKKFIAFHQGGDEAVRQLGAAGDAINGYPVYLDGQLRQKSWWYYYLLTLVYKVPEGTWLLVVASLGVLAFSRRSGVHWLDELTVLMVPAFVLFVMSVFTNINLGLRYVLLILPFVYVAAGKLGPWSSGLTEPRARGAAWGLIALGLSATAAATLWIHPHYLAYFNTLSGGPDRGAEHLIDSNIDWGQDLVGLRRWLEKNAPGERVGLAYFGQIHPRIFNERGEGFDWFLPPPALRSLPRVTSVQDLLRIPPRYRGQLGALRLEPGLYAVSASLVKGLPWRVYDRPVASYEADRWAPWEVWFDAFSYFDRLRPVDKVAGDSIWIYRVSPEQAEQLAPALNARPGPDPD